MEEDSVILDLVKVSIYRILMGREREFELKNERSNAFSHGENHTLLFYSVAILLSRMFTGIG